VDYCGKNVCWRSRQFGTSAQVSARHFGTGARRLNSYENVTLTGRLSYVYGWVKIWRAMQRLYCGNPKRTGERARQVRDSSKVR